MRPTLFLPHLCSLRNRFFPDGRLSRRSGLILLFGLVLAAGLFLLSLRVVGYFHAQNELGVILSLKIFQMAWVIMFAMLLFSIMVAAISALFLSEDNEILVAAPVPVERLFLMRYFTTILANSWMMLVFSLPIFAAYGLVFSAGPLYWPLLLTATLSTAFTAGGLALALTIGLVTLFPARRTRDIVLYLSLLFGVLLYLVIRLLRPEDLADPERFPDFLEYLSALQNPAAPLLPSSWPANLLTVYLQDGRLDPLLLGLLLLTPPVMAFLGQACMKRWFFRGYTKAQESFGGRHRFRSPSYRPGPARWFFRRELALFLRDSNEWSQLFLIGALVVVYLYNFKALPLDRSPFPREILANMISYANIGLTGFLVASLSARFVYPSIGAEGGGFVQIRTSPLGLWRYILYKYLFYVLPFTFLTLVLLLTSNHFLQITGPMYWISLATGLIITWGIVGMALGFGAMYADFRAANRNAVVGGFGAILFLFTGLSMELIIIGAGAYPAYRLVRSELHGRMSSGLGLAVVELLLVLLLTLLAGLWCVRQGIRTLEDS